MSQNISANGAVITIIASNSYPTIPITITQFTDDADAIDISELTFGAGAMGPNGDAVYWSTPNPVDVSLNIIPSGEDDAKLANLFSLNRIGEGKSSAGDTIKMTITYMGISPTVYTEGWITTGSPAQSADSTGRKKSKKYSFSFGSFSGV